MSRLLKGMLLLACALGLTGCLDITDTYTFNPDGSGKVVHEAVLAQMNLSMGGASEAPSEEDLKKIVLEEIKQAKGVEAWRDISYEQRGADRFYFKGTAYFRDVNEVKFYNTGAAVNVYDKVSLRNEDGRMILTIASSDDAEPDDSEIPDITEENVDEEITKMQGEYQKTRMMAGGIFSGIKRYRTFYLPGTVVSSSNLERTEDGALASRFEGIKLLEFMDRMMNDKEVLREELLKGNDPLQGGPSNEEALNEYVFGEAAPVEVIITPGTQPQFDYTAEVAQAAAEFPSVAETLGAPKKAVARGPEGSQFKVGGVRIVHDSDMENNVRPFNYDEGFTLSIIGRLPQEVLSVTEGQLLKAETDHGQDLLPSDEWKQKISFPRLSEDKRKVIFEVDLRRPAESAKGIKEISGVLTYLVADKTRRVDLGVAAFVAGSKGNEFGAEIESVTDSEWNPGRQELKLKLKINKDAVKAIDIFDAAGNKLDVSQGYFASGDNVTFNYTREDNQPFPGSGHIEIEVYEDQQRYELPFKLTDLSLLGRKLN